MKEFKATQLADHADYRITLHETEVPDHSTLVITFGGQPSDISDEGFGTRFFTQHGFNTIYVAQRSTTEFQGLSLEDFLDAVRPVCEGKDVVCYGSSLGGYAALYYGGALNARILAAAPLLPPWHEFGKQSYYKDHKLTHRELWEVPRTSHKPLVIYDPIQRRDKVMFDKMVKRTYGDDLQTVAVPHGGHTVLLLMAEAGLLKPFVLDFVIHDRLMEFDVPAEGYSLWHGTKGCDHTRTDPEIAKRELMKSVELAPHARFVSVLLTMLLQRGEVEDAQDLVDTAREKMGKKFRIMPGSRTLAEAAGLTLN